MREFGRVRTVLTDLLGVPDVCGILDGGSLVFIDRNEVENTESLKIYDGARSRVVPLRAKGRPVSLQSTRATAFDRRRRRLFLVEELEVSNVRVKCVRLDDGEVTPLLEYADIRALCVAPESLFLMDRNQILVVSMDDVDRALARADGDDQEEDQEDDDQEEEEDISGGAAPASSSNPPPTATPPPSSAVTLSGVYHAASHARDDADDDDADGNFSTMVFGPDNAIYLVDTTAQRSLCRYDVDRQRFDVLARVPPDRPLLWGPDFSSSLAIDSDRNLFYTHMGTEVTSSQWISKVDLGKLLRGTALEKWPPSAAKDTLPNKHQAKKTTKKTTTTLPSRLPALSAFHKVAEVASPRFFLLDDERGLLYVASCRWVPGVHDMICEILTVDVPSKRDRYLDHIMPLLLTFDAVGRGTAELKTRKWTRQSHHNDVACYNVLDFLARRFAITRYLLATIFEFAYFPRLSEATGEPSHW
eukprot:CAMPEP_0118905520 /NCGR_PEP_ID=MMETSP1166-20130328/9488_1 /TAXON_ID=1104430 /ORGANISM="Chrysoreinhardia sp, Strain CCMP3193" /LENGTH=472 /DNA_ID=CAMNT_0006844791 /DNA_START=182 /DNA_END=1597 /DNA_ORIENTATION=-